MKRRNGTYNIVLILLIIAVVILYFVYTSPSYSLYKTKRAIEKHDYAMFTKYINLDSVINNAMNKIQENKLDSNDTLEKLELELKRSIVFGLMPQAMLIIKNQFEKGIENGNFDYLFINRFHHSGTKQRNLWDKIKNIRIEDLEFVNRSGSNVMIGINCYPITNARKFIFRIRMCRIGDHWQIVELIDFINFKILLN